MNRLVFIANGELRICGYCKAEFLTRQEAREHGFRVHGEKFAYLQDKTRRREAKPTDERFVRK